MVTRTTKTRLATAGASLAIIAAVAGAGFALPSDAAWAATNPAGLTQLRFTHEQVRYEPDHVRRILAQTASRFAIATK